VGSFRLCFMVSNFGVEKTWALVGLGNPGDAYAATRHNIGFWLVDDYVLQHLHWSWKRSIRMKGWISKGYHHQTRLTALKPNTFMNASGKSVHALLKYLKLGAEQLVCIYDDITLETGRLKLSIGGGDGGHNGIKDIQRMIGNSFVRFRVGIGSKPYPEMDLKDYVLSRFSSEESALFQTNKAFYRNSIDLILNKGPVLAMNTINQNKPNL